MKIHRIQTRNLNSLYGSFTIDFDQHFNNVPLFLIHGPTGAGKSTLLDAICLALYGQTPRLRTSNNTAGEESTRHIMSNGTTECFASVMFSLRSTCGTTRTYYRAEWRSELKITRKFVNGRIDNAHRSLFRVDENDCQIGEPLAASDMPKDYREHFANVLQGMDIHAFQRSVMLAQGQFSEFLKAGDDQKAAILERLTDTSKFLDIGARAGNRKKSADEALRNHKSKMEGITVLKPEAILELETERNSLKIQADAHELELKVKREQTQWIQAFLTVTGEYQTATSQRSEKQTIREQHAEDFERLERDITCQPAAAIQSRVQDARQNLSDLENRLPGLRETVEETQKSENTTAELQKQAASALVDAKNNLAQAEPALQKARELHAALNTSNQELKKEKERQQSAAKSHDDAITAHKTAGENHQAASSALANARKTRDALEYAAPISENLADWKNRATQLDTTRATLKNKQRDAHTTTTDINNLTQELDQKNQLLVLENEKLAPLAANIQTTQEAIDLMLRTNNAADIPALRELFKTQATTAQERKASLKSAQENHTLLESRSDSLKKLTDERDALTESLKDLNHRQALAQKSVESAEEAIKIRKESLQVLAIAQSYSEARRNLGHDSECPVCGSLDHPFKSGNNHDQAEHELETRYQAALAAESKAEQQLKDLRLALTEAGTATKVCEHNLKTSSERIAELTTEIQTISSKLLNHLQQAGFKLASAHDWTNQDYSTQRTAADQAVELATKNSQALQEAVDAHAAAEKLHQNAREQSHSLNENISVLKTKIEGQKKQLDALNQETQALENTIQNHEKLLLESLRTCNIEVPEINERFDFPAALASAENLKKDFDNANQAVIGCTQQEQITEKNLLTAQATLDACEKNLQAAEQSLSERKKQHSVIDEQYAACLKDFDGKSPDEMEAEYKNAINRADKQLEDAQAAHHGARDAHTRAQTELEGMTNLHGEITDKLALENKQFAQILAELQLDEETLKANLLEPDERKALQEKTTKISDELKGAQTLYDAAVERFDKQKASKPEALANLESSDELMAYAQKLTEESAALETQRDAMNEQIGGINAKLAESERAGQKHLALQQQLEVLERDANTWNEIHKLIGTSNGKKFQQFAQSLNLSELIRTANTWLEKLFPRYQLGVLTENGEPSLSFTIIDLENAEQARPINTLSGGETFVVSLALALALADFSQVRMPLETILLDEGFGTLDSDTLNKVLNVLNTLQQQSGRQIGIISHVEGLTERIDHRIHIEKQSKTRSNITIITGDVTTDAASPETSTELRA